MLKQYTNEERRQREKKMAGIWTAILRLICSSISILIVVGLFYFFSEGGGEELKSNEDFRRHSVKLALLILTIFTMTTLYAIKGEKSVRNIHRMFKQ